MAPQSTPAGWLVTVPEPVPARLTVSVRDTAVAVNVAVAFLAASIVSWQVVAAPVQSPLQPAKVEPVAGAAVSVTVAPSAKSCAQVAPQSTPAGWLVTVPEPVPARLTVRVRAPAVGVWARCSTRLPLDTRRWTSGSRRPRSGTSRPPSR